MSEIATASIEQSRGIEEVNQAITQMDSVVQHGAANAEEGASASEELSAQALQMKEAVDELVAMVRGGKMNNGHAQRKATAPVYGKRLSAPSAVEKAPAKLEISSKGKEVKPEKVIPFHEQEEFTDF